MATEVGNVLSSDEMLARAKSAAASKTKLPAGASKIQQMLAGREEDSDKVDLSPVAKLLQSQAKPAQQKSFTDEDWYLKAKVAQLKQQINTYSTLPGLDPTGAVMDGLTKEVNDIVKKQRATLEASRAEGVKKQAELDEKRRLAGLEPMSVKDMLSGARNRANGIVVPEEMSDEVKALLKRVKGAVVDKSA